MDAFFASAAAWASVALLCGRGAGLSYALFAAWAARGFARSPTPLLTKPIPPSPSSSRCMARSRISTPTWPASAPRIIQARCKSFSASDDPADPAVAVVRDLIADFPDRDLELVVDPRRHGANRKVSNLINMAGQARHEVLVISDSDIVVAPDYLRTHRREPRQPGVGTGDLSLSRRRRRPASGRGLPPRRSIITSCRACWSGSSSVLADAVLRLDHRAAQRRRCRRSAASKRSPINWPTTMRLARWCAAPV